MAEKKSTTAGNPIARGVEFSQDSWTELKKIHFPSGDETLRWTVTVFIMLLISAFFLGAADWIVGGIMQKILT